METRIRQTMNTSDGLRGRRPLHQLDSRLVIPIGAILAFGLVDAAYAQPRPRAREIGIDIGIFPPGPNNAITDVRGVLVGHETVVESEDVRTGVTAILPHGGNLFQEKVPAAIVVGNGFGKIVGVTQVAELGTIETPIVLTNTLSTFTAADGLIDYTLGLDGNAGVRSVNPIVAETNDGYLNDIRARAVTRKHVFAAIRGATGGPVKEGCVGAGTGTRCFGFKGGIGTSSRRLPESLGGFTVGVLVQSNFDGVLTIAGAPVGEELGRIPFQDDAPGPFDSGKTIKRRDDDDGSCVIVVATDAPLDARQLERLGRRALLGLAATGSSMSHGSGDYVIAFSADPAVREHEGSDSSMVRRLTVRDERLSPLFQACKEATEEAIINSVLKASTTTGHKGRSAKAIPIEKVIEVCRHHRVIRK
jgi:D-aminopeptidase